MEIQEPTLLSHVTTGAVVAGNAMEILQGMRAYMSATLLHLLHTIESRDAVVAVIGLGYVGLPLAVTFAEAGFEVVGIDLDARKVDQINRGTSYIEDIPAERVRRLTTEARLRATTDVSVLAQCDAVSICVPTPLNKTGAPDISYIISATEHIAQYVHPGMLVVLESTTYPGTTAEVILPLLNEKAPTLTVGEDFFVCFSPERVDPGRSDWTTRNTPKVMGGVTAHCLQAGRALYESAIDRVVAVSSPAAAEMVKLLENTFRAVNIGLVNEVLLMCDKLGLDAWEIIEAAATKPFGFMKFTPGPGLGGHCIPIDPLYLSWKLKTLDYNARFIELANEVNTAMPRYWVHKVQDALNDVGKPIKGSRIVVLGVAYKQDVSDVRESPAVAIIERLLGKGAHVQYHDPYVAALDVGGIPVQRSHDLDDAMQHADCVIVATDHSCYDWGRVRDVARLLIDTRHVAG